MATCLRSTKGESTVEPNWLELPRDVTEIIFQKLSVVDIVTGASQVCSLWWNICKNPLMYRTIVIAEQPPYFGTKLVKICRCAIDRSCGHVEDISIAYYIFVTEGLFKYIADKYS